MKKFMFLLALGLAASEKLDRTYLPPPGSKYAGGEPGDLQAPLEYPKDAYTTTAPFEPGPKNDGLITIGDTQLVPGSDRGISAEFPGISKDIVPVTPANKPTSNFYQHNVPTTTTSYAFTQTTTFPPPEGFETTLSPLPTGFPVDGTFSNQLGFVNQPLNQGQIVDHSTGQIYPAFQPGNQIPQRPGLPIVPFPGINTSGVQTFPIQTVDGRPGYPQTKYENQYQGLPATKVTSIPSSAQRRIEQGFTQHLGVQPPRQFIQQVFPATPGFQNNLPYQYNENIPSVQGILNRQPVSPTVGPQQSTTQYVDKYGNIQNALPTYTVPQQEGNRQQITSQGSKFQPGQTGYGGDLNSYAGTSGINTSPQQGIQGLQAYGSLGSVPQNVVPQGTGTGLLPAQREENLLPQYTSQQDGYQYNRPLGTKIQQQGENVQLTGPLQGLAAGQKGLVTGQGNQRPQYINQATKTSTGTIQPGTIGEAPKVQQLQSGGQQTLYPSAEIAQGIPGQQPSGQQSQFGREESSIATGFAPQYPVPGQVLPQQGQPQRNGQQGLFPSITTPQVSLPSSQVIYKPQGQQQQGQQDIVSSTGFPESSTQQPFVYEDSSNVQISNTIPGLNKLQDVIPDQQEFSHSGSRQDLFPNSQSQISSQAPIAVRPGEQGITKSGLPNIYRPGTPDYQQILSPSTTPSSISPYGTMSGSLAPSSTPAYSTATSTVYRPERPQAESERNAVILNYENVLSPDGYAYSFDTSNGIHADENGTTIQGTRAKGSYSYIGDDGKLYNVMYTADENGFRPFGDHLPTPPPVPAAIQRVIDQAAKDKEAGISHDGFYDEAKYGHKKYQGPKNRRPESQDRIFNGVDIPDEHSINFDKTGNQKKFRPKEERKPVSSTKDQQYSKEKKENEETSNDRGSKVSDADRYDMVSKPINRKMPFIQSVTKRPGKDKYESEQGMDQISGIDERREQQITGQRASQRKPQQKGKNSFVPRPNIPDQRRPVSLKERYNSVQNDDQETTFEELPTKYTKEEEDSGRIELSGKPLKRPGYFGTQLDLQQSFNKEGKPQKPSYGSQHSFGTNYSVTDQTNPQVSEMPDEKRRVTGRPKGTKRPDSETTRYEQSKKQLNKVDDLRDNYPVGIKFEQKGRPQYNQDTKDYKYLEQDEETGYQYTPPERKFYQGEKDTFQSRFSDKVTSMRPSTKYETADQQTTAQPFITPNVHRDEDESYEDVSEESKLPKKPGKGYFMSTTPEYEEETSEQKSELFNGQNESIGDQDSSEEMISENKRPETPFKVSKTHRPGYQAKKTTSKPQDHETNMPDDYDISQRRLPRPGQKLRDRYPSDSSNNTLGRPGQGYLQDNIETSETPEYTYIPSTTAPSRRRYRPGSKQPSEQEDQSKGTTVFETSDTSSTEDYYTDDTTRPEITTTYPKYSKNPAIKPDSSTKLQTDSFSRPTTRPNYDYSEEEAIPGAPTIRPGLSESAFGGPSFRPSSIKKPSYSTATPVLETIRPETSSTLPDRSSTSVDRYYNQNKPSSVTFPSRSDIQGPNYQDMTLSSVMTDRPGISRYPDRPRTEGLPSTTYRPNYSITSISQPNSDSVDNFGRPVQPVQAKGAPVNQSGQYGTTGPDYYSTIGPKAPAAGRPSTGYEDAAVNRPGQPGSQGQAFKPNESRFGSAVQGAPGPKPLEFGPSSITTPGYLQPYGPSTKKIIGEDFSGPKQPQKFDPETGYYY